MDETTRGIATAALTLHSMTLEALITRGLVNAEKAVETVNKSLAAIVDKPEMQPLRVAEAAAVCLRHLRQGLAARS